MADRFSNVIGIDDGPFSRAAGSSVLIAGPVFSACRLDGLLTTSVQRDGLDATEALIRMINESRFAEHIQLIMLGGVTVGGFNILDLHKLSSATERPVLAIVRRQPDMRAIDRALENVSEADARRSLLRSQGTAEHVGNLFIHRVGLSTRSAEDTISALTIHGNLPEPLRIAHILAGGIATGRSRGAA
jgi:uncharacterized protein